MAAWPRQLSIFLALLPCAHAVRGARMQADVVVGSPPEVAGGALLQIGAYKIASSARSIRVKRDWITLPECSEKCNAYVSDSIGKDQGWGGYGGSVQKPFKTISFALRKRVPGQTIHIMAGTYTNDGYGSGSLSNKQVVNLDGVSDVVIRNYENDRVVIKFDGQGGFVGGSTSKPVENVELFGLEIVGPNMDITYEMAKENRLTQDSYFSGRGIAIWNGHHIHLHSMNVYNCPNSGLRVNNGDYLLLEDSEVFNNTWWSSNAESGIVFAQSKNVDNLDTYKMIMRHNKVYGNVNKIPYFNRNYAYDYSPIGKADCNIDACRDETDGCPWTCRYGKATQDYIIDGQGVYVTRNKDTYLAGRMELSNNVAYGNGINGLVFHRTNRGIVKNNVVYGNGVVPPVPTDIAGIPVPFTLQADWHAGLHNYGDKTGRQPYSGIVLNEAEDVEVTDNAAAARLDTDFAFVMQMDGGHAYPVRGSGNKVCRGKASLDPMTVFTNPTVESSSLSWHPSMQCSDEPTAYMVGKGLMCDSWPWGIDNYCKKSDEWRKNRYCQHSCFMAGVGYDGDYCCKLDDVAPAWMVKGSKSCADFGRLEQKCNRDESWRNNKFCARSCFFKGVGYEGSDCCGLATQNV
eukprot:TRINITY_DN83213_c0_g1_i1.p1 TRINITY_DN83213_c0_g1~~TRINITY_DN83213_c0_g1_i1.p1  ORF type:complete len:646 (-),score=44.29 TRINITY_DN83213_c0_g1_i1:52-1938(-)